MNGEAGALELFGTEEPVPERRQLRAGRLSAILEEGNLRDIRFGGVEIVRAVNYLARDASWGTYRAALSDVRIEETEAFFEVRYAGLCGEAGTGFSYRMHIRGEADGRLILTADGVALADFDTNRTGFVILHPASVAGGRLTVRHSDGSEEATAFPDAISADQPAFDIEALTHEPAPGVTCTVEMAGDAFEMEDQRNWADASFKTYVRPLAKPRPYRIAKGQPDSQRIAIAVRGSAGATGPEAAAEIDITLGPRGGRMPEMALFIADAADLGDADRPALPMQKLVVRIDPLRPDAERLARIAAFAAASGATIAAECIFDTREPEREAGAALRLLAAAGIDPAALLVSPRREFFTRASGTLPAGEQPVAASVEALRRAGFSGPIGAGTPSYFTEFNRNPPGPGADFVHFSVAATVHAADDVSVMETLEVYPQLAASARRLCPGAAVWLGPCTIGARHNPYGADVQPNPGGGRVPSARLDPRQGALFGAAFAAGVAARAAEADVALLMLAAPAGPFGLVGPDGRLRPIHAVQAELAKAAGAEGQGLRFSAPGLAGAAYWTQSGLRAILANLTAEPLAARLPAPLRTALRIEADAGLAPMSIEAGRIVLPPYRTVLLAD